MKSKRYPDPETVLLIQAGNMLGAIQRHRARYPRAGLKAAKDYVVNLREKLERKNKRAVESQT